MRSVEEQETSDIVTGLLGLKSSFEGIPTLGNIIYINILITQINY